MRKQELFDRVVTHLRQQGGPAMDETKRCRYRAADGRRCAIGVLIPKEQYQTVFEDVSVRATNLIGRQLRVAAGLPEDPQHPVYYLAELLQQVHDRAAKFAAADVMAFWERSWRVVARRYGLRYTPPEAAC